MSPTITVTVVGAWTALALVAAVFLLLGYVVGRKAGIRWP